MRDLSCSLWRRIPSPDGATKRLFTSEAGKVDIAWGDADAIGVLIRFEID